MPKAEPIHWLALVSLAIMWGSAYVLIEVALQSFTPLAITAWRTAIAATLLAVILLVMRADVSAALKHWRYCVLVAVLGNCLPFYLTSAGQTTIDSAMAGLVLSATPLLVVVLAHFGQEEEPLTFRRLLGFLLGFAGVAVLVIPEMGTALGAARGHFAVLGAAFCYALTAVLVRNGPEIPVRVYSTVVLLMAAAILVPLTVANEGATGLWPGDVAGRPWLALLALGVVVTGLSAIVYFYIIATMGAGFQSLTNYLIPLWAVLLGALTLGERIPARAIVALGVILAGVALAQYPSRKNLPLR